MTVAHSAQPAHTSHDRAVDHRAETRLDEPTNLRYLLTPDDDPDLAAVDNLEGLDALDDYQRRALITAHLRAVG